jgi:hypothetical protein
MYIHCTWNTWEIGMAINKTLYVRDEDVAVWDKAKEIVGDKMSALITNYLKDFVVGKTAFASGNQRIVVSFRELGRLPRSISFYGKWLLNPAAPWEREFDFDSSWQYAVALTAKGRIVVLNLHDGAIDENGVYRWGELRVFESFAEASCDHDVPTELIALAMSRKGIEIEVLDI